MQCAGSTHVTCFSPSMSPLVLLNLAGYIRFPLFAFSCFFYVCIYINFNFFCFVYATFNREVQSSKRGLLLLLSLNVPLIPRNILTVINHPSYVGLPCTSYPKISPIYRLFCFVGFFFLAYIFLFSHTFLFSYYNFYLFTNNYYVAVNPNQNSVLWNAMIYPLLPTSIFGVLWYQGEQNTFEASIYGYVLSPTSGSFLKIYFHF